MKTNPECFFKTPLNIIAFCALLFIASLTFAQPITQCSNLLLGNNNDADIGVTYTVPATGPFSWYLNGIPIASSPYVTTGSNPLTYTITSPNTIQINTWSSFGNGPYYASGILKASDGTSDYSIFIHDAHLATSPTIPHWHNATLSSVLTAQQMLDGYITQNFQVSGDLIIDVDFEFRDCNILLNADAKIIIPPYRNLWLHSTGVGGAITRLENMAKTMWDGIYIQTDVSSLKISSDDINYKTEFTNSKNGVVSENGGHFDITRTKFLFNNICIQVKRFPLPHTGHVSGCYFDGAMAYGNNALTSYFTCPTYSNWLDQLPRTYAGVLIENVSHINIGDPVGEPNEFHKMDYGINSLNSNIDVNNNKFFNLTSINYDPAYINGIGVYAMSSLGGPLTTANIGTQTGNYFEYCNLGIYLENKIKTIIYDNKFTSGNSSTDPAYHITIMNAGLATAEIYENNLSRR